MKRVLFAVVAALILLAAPVLSPAVARADDDTPAEWRISRYDVAARTDAAGTTTVTLNFDFHFGNAEGRGPLLYFPLRQEVGGNPDVWRMVDLDLGAVTSPTGAPTDVATEVRDGVLIVRIGDEDVYLDGTHSYTITYTASGLIARDQPQSRLDEVNWNAVGNGWVDEHPGMLIGYQRRIQGAIFGACNPLFDVPRLLSLYRTGDLKLDELITRTYRLDEVNQGYQDMLDGKNIRGVIIHEH